MPFVRLNDDGFMWRYRQNEVVDLRIICNSRMLIITTDIADPSYTLKVPSVDIFNETGTLEHLEIWDMDVVDMPRIPSCVRSLEITNTNLTSLDQIRANWANMETLILDTNKMFRGSVIVPEGVKEFAMMNQSADIIRFPPGIQKVRLGSLIRFTQLTGHLPQEILYLFGKFAHPYKHELDEMKDICENEIRTSLPMDEEFITAKWHQRMMAYIERVNHKKNYIVYQHFGSIPKRIRVSAENIDNPIVVAMNLSSNYPRRMAEFISEYTVS